MSEATRSGATAADGELAAIIVHGRNQDAAFARGLQERLGRDQRVAYWLPEADRNSWYPDRFMAPVANNEPWLGWGLEAVDRALAAAREEGFDASRTVLVGFSQGACLLAEHLARRGQRPGAVALLTGALVGPLDPARELPATLAGLPAFLGTARHDEWVPLEYVEATAACLERAGAETSLEVYEDTEHHVNDEEIARVRALIDGLLAGERPPPIPTSSGAGKEPSR